MNAGLNPEQLEAVQTLSGPLLVLAGAGSGKTRVVTFRIANLIKHGIAPDRILAVTFTNKAAREMRERIGGMLGKSRRRRPKSAGDAPTPVIGTFHSHCVQILRRHTRKFGYPERFAIYDRSDQESVAREVLRHLHVPSTILRPGDFLSIISRWKNAGVRFEQAGDQARTDGEHVAASGYRRYQETLRLAGAMDFDDLLLFTEDLLSNNEEVRREEAGRFDHILVDEYQDTNQSQYSIIRTLAMRHQNLCVVGDDDQSIYGWRGAEVKHILGFSKDWPKAKVVRLEANYRSTARILGMANTLIAFNSVRHDKVLRPARAGGKPPRVEQHKNEIEEAKAISEEVRRILDRGERQPEDFAILFRTNEQPRVFETELRRMKVPYALVGTQSFFDRKEIRDLLCYLKVADNQKDEVSLLRVINTPQRGVGAKSVEAVLNQAVSQGRTAWDVMIEPSVQKSLPLPAQSGIRRFQQLILGVSHSAAEPNQSLTAIVNKLIQDLNYEAQIRRIYRDPEEADARWSSVQELINAVAEYEADSKQPSLKGFLDEVTLAGKEFGSNSDDQRKNAVSLMTYHSAKGLEFPLVYMVGMEEGILPHRMSLKDGMDNVEEERRLCYVGITRAEDELTLSFPLERKKWGKPRPTFVSRFLYEMTGQSDNPKRLESIQGARREMGGFGAARRQPANAKSSGKRSASKPESSGKPHLNRSPKKASRPRGSS